MTAAQCACRFTLKLGNYYLAPRPSITVIESSDFEQLVGEDSAAALCNCGSVLTQDRQFTFKLVINGRGSLATAWSVHARIAGELESASCEMVLLRRRVCDEPWLIYKVTKASLRVTDVESQYEEDRVLTLELKLTLSSNVNPPILTIYEHATFPQPPTFIIDPFPQVDTLYEQAQFPEPENIFV